MIEKFRILRSDKEPLLLFLIDGLESAGCSIIRVSDPSFAPYEIYFQQPNGQVCGVLAYVFFANKYEQRNRPADEHRFQIKYGSDLKRLLHIHQHPDPRVTTVVVGIDPLREILVGVDPEMHRVCQMSTSIEFKASHVESILKKGWLQWERTRRNGADGPVEVLVGCTKDRVADYLQFEDIASGFDPGHRLLFAESFDHEKVDAVPRHRLLEDLSLPSDDLYELIDSTPRLKMAVRGHVAEYHLERFLRTIPEVTDCYRINEEGMPDVSLRWRGKGPIIVECKNVLAKSGAHGQVRLDFQKTRSSKGDKCSRYYRNDDFDVVAACLHPIEKEWSFCFHDTSTLTPHSSCPGRIHQRLEVNTWSRSASEVLSSVAAKI